MKITDLRVSVHNVADKSDPLNQGLAVSARALVDGVPCAWRGDVNLADTKLNERQSLEVAIGRLVLHMLREPTNRMKGGAPAIPQTPIEIPPWET